MKQKSKDTLLIVTGVLGIAFCVMALTSNQTIAKVQQELEQERYKRITAEENLHKTSIQLTSLENDLAGAQDRIKSVQAILDQGKTETTDMKAQLESLSKTKEALEQKISELSTASAQPAAPAPSTVPAAAASAP